MKKQDTTEATPEEKVCSRPDCIFRGKPQPLSNFYSMGRLDSRGRKELRANCKKCHNKQTKPHIAAYHKRRYKNDPIYKLGVDQRANFSQFLRDGSCSEKVEKMIGCDRETLNKHLESQFQEGMSWENYGEWEIDHTFPLSMGDIEDWVHRDILWSYHNLRPLWKHQNKEKGSKMPWEYIIK